jgi:hypothetical protein
VHLAQASFHFPRLRRFVRMSVPRISVLA